MPWKEMSDMSQRREFVELAQAEGTNKRGLCRRFGISPTTGYKWLGRFREGSEAGLVELPRRPHYSPARTPSQVEQAVLSARAAHPAWGARKLRRWLLDRRDVFEADMPAPSTITAILRRHGRIDPAEGPKHRSWQRFEHQAPNDLWQMDFKGHFPLTRGRCHPLTVLDDHSRFALGLQACGNEQGELVQQRLTAIFRRYGLPNTMLMDNGSPWGHDQDHPYTPFTVWLLRLGIGVSHGRPYHPQTQGKDERFHRTMSVEVLQGSSFTDLAHCQRAFDQWRDIYNLERPHDALDLATPATKYQVSQRLFPEVLPPLEYEPTDLVRRVHDKGRLQLFGRIFKVPKAFKGMPVAIRPTTDDGVWNVFFATHQIAQLDLRHDA